MDASNDKQTKFLTKGLGYGKEKGKLYRETESLLKAAENNAKRTNYVKAKIDKTQQNNKYRLCGDRDETIKHMISQCYKLA